MLLKHHPVVSASKTRPQSSVLSQRNDASKVIQPTERPDSLLSNYRRWLILWYAPPHYRADFYW
jgi:hypothetical protein